MDTAILTISPQGQITIPKEWRNELEPSQKIYATKTKNPNGKSTQITLTSGSLVDLVAGTGKGLWGVDSDKYLNNSRDEWNKENE